jgi:hypothetical protein
MDYNAVRLFLMSLVGASLTWLNWIFISVFTEKIWVRVVGTVLMTILLSWLFVKLFM